MNTKTDTMTYAGTGVNYEAMDPFKKMCQLAARKTARNIADRGNGEYSEFEPSRGESAYLIETPTSYLAHVEEGLGTKNLVADEMYKLTGESFYENIAQDTVAMIVNDVLTVGAMPLSVAMHLAVGSSDWFKDEKRSKNLIEGWKRACDLSGAVWGGGETPTLKDVVLPEACVLAGSAMGVVQPKERLIDAANIRHGDVIIFATSSGIHANGLTLARRIAEKLPKGYLTELPDGRTYGETLLDPTHIYARFVEHCVNIGVRFHYLANITGHGWRKLMRAPGNFTYVIDKLPPPLPIFDFLQEHGPVDDREAYGNLNMGAGFAFMVSPRQVPLIMNSLLYGWAHGVEPHLGISLVRAGHVERSKPGSEKRVIIEPKGLEYLGETLQVR